MRGIAPICCDVIMDVISSHNKCEDLYRDIFTIYGLPYDTETIKQKRVFVAAVTEYFILKNCSNIKRLGSANKYTCGRSPKSKKAIVNAINNYFKIRAENPSKQDFKERYAQLYNEDVRDFSNEISINRDDTLSDFAKAVEQLYYFKDEDKGR